MAGVKFGLNLDRKSAPATAQLSDPQKVSLDQLCKQQLVQASHVMSMQASLTRARLVCRLAGLWLEVGRM